jgi:hypothetical protein
VIAFAYSWLVEGCMILMQLRIEFIILATIGPTIELLSHNGCQPGAIGHAGLT